MTTDMTRRTLVKSAAWSVPVIAAAVAMPLAAASTVPETKNRIRFTNATATVGKEPNTVYVNTKVQVIDGPDAVQSVTLIVALGGRTFHKVWALVPGWGSTEQVYFEFPDVPKGEPVTVTFYADADGVTAISNQVSLNTPSWWN